MLDGDVLDGDVLDGAWAAILDHEHERLILRMVGMEIWKELSS